MRNSPHHSRVARSATAILSQCMTKMNSTMSIDPRFCVSTSPLGINFFVETITIFEQSQLLVGGTKKRSGEPVRVLGAHFCSQGRRKCSDVAHNSFYPPPEVNIP